MDLGWREELEVEGIAPTLKCLIEIQTSMQNGNSVRVAALDYLDKQETRDDCAQDLRAFLFALEQGRDGQSVLSMMRSPQRRALFSVLACGFKGQAISQQLTELQAEIVSACEGELKHHLEVLPIKMLMPLLLLQFPAFLLLIFGPLLRHLLEELSR